MARIDSPCDKGECHDDLRTAIHWVRFAEQVYGVRGESTAESRFEAATVTGLTLLVGREEELGLLLRRWEQAKDGEGQVVLLGGEPDIGKSRITQTLVERLAGEPHTIRKFWHPDNPGITMLSNWTELGRPKGIRDAGSYWHSDYSYRKRPANVTMLYALEIPDEGGDTLFADLCAAYQALNSEMQARLEGLTYRGQYRWHKDRNHPESMWQLLTPEERKHNPEVVHPVVRTHPETADKALFVFPSYGAGIKGIVDMDTSESDALIQLLFDHVTDPRFQYRFKWPGPGTLILWDNRCTMHAATTNVLPPDKFRTLLRISIVGDVPY